MQCVLLNQLFVTLPESHSMFGFKNYFLTSYKNRPWIARVIVEKKRRCIILLSRIYQQIDIRLIKKVKGKDIEVRNRNHLTATGNHVPYGITQFYLPPGRGNFPAFTPAEAGTRFSDPTKVQYTLWFYLFVFITSLITPLACHTYAFVNKAPFWNVNIVICYHFLQHD